MEVEVEPILPRHVRRAASRVRASTVVGVVGEGTPPLVDVDLLVLEAHLDALRAAVAAAFDLVSEESAITSPPSVPTKIAYSASTSSGCFWWSSCM